MIEIDDAQPSLRCITPAAQIAETAYRVGPKKTHWDVFQELRGPGETPWVSRSLRECCEIYDLVDALLQAQYPQGFPRAALKFSIFGLGHFGPVWATGISGGSARAKSTPRVSPRAYPVVIFAAHCC